jgi:hypothetical protein
MSETNAERAEHLAEIAKSGGPGIRHDTRALVYAPLAVADAIREIKPDVADVGGGR